MDGFTDRPGDPRIGVTGNFKDAAKAQDADPPAAAVTTRLAPSRGAWLSFFREAIEPDPPLANRSFVG